MPCLLELDCGFCLLPRNFVTSAALALGEEGGAAESLPEPLGLEPRVSHPGLGAPEEGKEAGGHLELGGELAHRKGGAQTGLRQ